MDAYASNETPNQRSSKYSDVNQAVWDWYTTAETLTSWFLVLCSKKRQR